MRALVWNGKEDVQVDTVPDPRIQDPRDVIVRITATAICGSDLHLYGGIMPGMEKGDVLGHEPMGIVNVEAMASGAPVVATRVGGVPEIVEHERTALLVAPEDPAALAAAIERVLRDPELAARLSAAGRAAAERFDWTAIAGQYRDIYRRVLASRR